MVYSGPQKYPGASTAYWYQNTFGGDRMESNVIVWHSTEGTSLPSYGGGASAPNFTALPEFANKRLKAYQHFDFDRSSRALVNKSGGVETNTLNVNQVEIVGTCDPATHKRWTDAGYKHLYMPELPDWAIRDLAAYAKWANSEHNVPLSSGLTFKAYPSSYGANGVRMSFDQWNGFKGHCGHQHVPENDHGDPGAFPMAAILTAAKGGTTTTAPQESSDVPHTLGRYSTDEITLVPGRWKTLDIEGVDLLEGVSAYDVMVQLTTVAPRGSTIQGRFYHQRTDGSRWQSGIVERPSSDGNTFADFNHKGSIKTDEALRFEMAYWPADPTDEKSILVTTSRARGLYWK